MKNGKTGHETHRWNFFSSGGVNQVILNDAEDLRNLDTLDLKLWMALSVPVKGVEFDPATAAYLDLDNDGFIRPGEILGAVRWACSVLKDPGQILTSATSLKLADIGDGDLMASAKRLLAEMGKPQADEIDLAEVVARRCAMADLPMNGDGILTVDAADTPELKAAMNDVIATQGPVLGKTGKQGLDETTLKAFMEGATAVQAWQGRLEKEASLTPLGPEGTAAALAALETVETKVDDYFGRCRLISFDPRAAVPLNLDEADFKKIATGSLGNDIPAIRDFPLALAAAGKPLPLEGHVNPAWADALADLASRTIAPLSGTKPDDLNETVWLAAKKTLEPYREWLRSKPPVPQGSIPPGRLLAFIREGMSDKIMALIEKDKAAAPAYASISDLEKLLRFRRDLGTILRNSVNFSDFYSGVPAIFQAGTLFMDARSCSLCLDATDSARHSALAGLSGAFLVYCELSRPGGSRRKITAIFTDGDSDTIIAGRNGIFIDRSGLDWNATVTMVILNPVSVRQAFWLPYKKFLRMIEEQVGKRAKVADESSNAKLAEAASTVASADKTNQNPAISAFPKKLDLGTIALIGTAIGGISALVAGIMQTLFSLGLWLPVGILGVVLLISGPSMVLASIKLRKRNLGPLLDANGWAINTRALVNIPFGATMTSIAALPSGNLPFLADPFAQKRSHWKRNLFLVFLALIVAAFVAWGFGAFDQYLSRTLRSVTILEWIAGIFKFPELPQ